MGSASDTISSVPAGIECGADCSEAYMDSTEVTLSATPDAGSTFSGWSDAGCSGTGTCVLSITQAQSVAASFEQEANQSLAESIEGIPVLTGNPIQLVGSGTSTTG